MASINHFTSIPLLDFSQFIQGSTKDRLHFVNQLRDACHEVGFFYIKNHGISPQLMQLILHLTKVFFDLSPAEKDILALHNSPHYRGYGKLGEEKTLGLPDKKETLDLGLEKPALPTINHPYEILIGPNQWPSTLNHLQWRETVLDYMQQMQALGQQLIAAMSLALGFTEDYLKHYFNAELHDAYAILRLLRYPGIAFEKNTTPALGVGPHVDAGCLILLLQDEVGGLQVQNAQGQWIDAPSIPHTFVVNIGEMLQIWSHHFFQATLHRVTNTSTRTRYSVPFFLEPNLCTVVSPLPIKAELLNQVQKPPPNQNHPVVYGEHMLKIYERSFKLPMPTVMI